MTNEVVPTPEPVVQTPTPAPQVGLDIDKLMAEIEAENTARLTQTKTEAIIEAKKDMVSADTVKQLLSKVNEAHSQQLSNTVENLNKQLTELKESITTQKGAINTATPSNPYSAQSQANYNVWKDPGISDEQKTEILIQNIRQGKFR